MRWVCKHCKLEFNFEKHQSRGAHITNCKNNPGRQDRLQKISKAGLNPTVEKKCERCEKLFYVRLKKEIEKRRFCSRICSSRRNLSEETVKKLKERNNYKRAHAKLRFNKQERHKLWALEADEFYFLAKDEPLFLLGVGLYWGEGHKRGQSLGMTNSDYNLLKLWIAWHKVYFPLKKLRGVISAHNDVDEVKAKEYWSTLGFEKSKMKLYRAIPSSSKGIRPRRRLPYGTLQILTGKGSTECHFKMMRWINLLGNNKDYASMLKVSAQPSKLVS